MKRTILTILIILIPSVCFADDYWVYVAKDSKYMIDKELNAACRKTGDIIDILPKTPQFIPTKKEKESYDIISIISPFGRKILSQYAQIWEGDDGKPIANRRFKWNYSTKTFELRSPLDLIAFEIGRLIYIAKAPLRWIDKKNVPPAYAAENVSTINKTGETYNTLLLWEDAKDGDITAGNAEAAECYDDDGLLTETTCVFMGGWTTDADSYVRIYTPTTERRSTAALILSGGASGAGFQVTTSDGFDGVFEVQDGCHHIRFEGLQINQTAENAFGIEFIDDTAAGDFRIEKCVIRATRAAVRVTVAAASAVYSIKNSLLYSIPTEAETDGVFNSSSANATTTINNCTVYADTTNMSRIINVVSGTVTANNTIGFGSTGLSWAGTIGGDYNADDDPDAANQSPGANSKHNLTLTNELEGTSDFRVKSTSAEVQDGGDSATAEADDIYGTARPSGAADDIGAHEYVSTGVTYPKQVI